MTEEYFEKMAFDLGIEVEPYTDVELDELYEMYRPLLEMACYVEEEKK